MLNEYDLNKSFQVIRMIQNTEDLGETEIPTLLKVIKGRLSSFSGNRQLMYDKETYTNSCRFYCMYHAEIAQSDYIRDIDNSKSYKIISIANPSGLNDHLEIDLYEIVSGQDLIPGSDWVDPEDGIVDGGYF